MSELIEKRFEKGGRYFVSPQLEMCPHVGHGFFTREGGVSKGIYESLNFRYTGSDDKALVEQNFKRAAEQIGGGFDHIVRTCQKHTDIIEVITEDQGEYRQVGVPGGCDALITNVPGVVLAGFYADCQLILLYDEKHHAIAAVHSGWRGVANRILAKTVERMGQEYGTQPKNIIAAVGPSICRRCFETDDDVPLAIDKYLGGDTRGLFDRRADGKTMVDLRAANARRLMQLGVKAENIDISSECTMCSHDKYWSHRYTKGRRGSQGAAIAL